MRLRMTVKPEVFSEDCSNMIVWGSVGVRGAINPCLLCAPAQEDKSRFFEDSA